jgi:hypothetical protein
MHLKFTQVPDNILINMEKTRMCLAIHEAICMSILRCGLAKIECSYVTLLSYIGNCLYSSSLPRQALCCFSIYYILLILHYATLTPFHG